MGQHAAELALLAEITEAARAEAAAVARKIELTKQYNDLRYTNSAPQDADMAARSSLAEIALALTTTYSVVSGWLTTSFALERMTDVAEAFTAGEISVPNIRTIIDHTTGAPDLTLIRLGSKIVAAAQRLAPRALGTEIDRLLTEADPDWATKARERAETTRNVTTRPLPNGMALLKSKLTATESVEIEQLITALTKTVCFGDPRELKDRRVDAFLALLRGHTSLACRCTDDDCPNRATTSATGPAVRLNIMCGLDTLLGIGDNPVYLAGYGTLDADKARTIAGDATWQAMITAATSLADKITPDEPAPEEPEADRDDPAGLPGGPLHPRNGMWVPPCYDAGLGNDAGLVIGRSKILPAGALAPKGGHGITRTRTTDTNLLLEKLIRDIETNPDQVRAEYPDGHGGFTEPPPGALTYHPSDALATVVRLRDGTCRHPGCTVPAANCQLDHIVEYLLANPHLGGWTILANLQCLCVFHHQLKTKKQWRYEMLRNAIIHASNTLGQHGLTLPAYR